MIERPTSKQKEEERKEFGDLFVNFEDDSDSELIDFVPKKVGHFCFVDLFKKKFVQNNLFL